MKSNNFAKYITLFQNKSFRNFWLGFLISNVGDAMTRVALNWYVWETTRSAKALGLLTFLYFGPVIFGGILAGWLLDRFDKRLVLQIDSLFRGVVVAVVPLLYFFDQLQLWHVYLIAAMYGTLMMVQAAGSPSIVPTLVQEEDIPTANAFEVFAFTISNIAGPALAGLLIAKVGAPYVVAIDALSYFLFAIMLMGVTLPAAAKTDEMTKSATPNVGFADAVKLLFTNKILLSTTAMFMLVNVGYGLLLVWMPIFADEVLGGGPGLYGGLLGIISAGEVLSTFIVGGWVFPMALGLLIAIAQTIAGVPIMLLAANTTLGWAGGMLFTFGIFHAPLTVWAQTLRMRIIPENLRGRTFALLRMIMMTGPTIGGALAGSVIVLVGIPGAIVMTGLFITIPGLAGLLVKELRQSKAFS